LTSTTKYDLQSTASYGHGPRNNAKIKAGSVVSKKYRVETNGWTNTTNRISFASNAIRNRPKSDSDNNGLNNLNVMQHTVAGGKFAFEFSHSAVFLPSVVTNDDVNVIGELDGLQQQQQQQVTNAYIR